MIEVKGIDVSRWQGDIDFEKIKKYGIKFVIIKCGGSDAGFYKDKKFEENYKKAKDCGLDIGTYYFVGKNFINHESGVADALRMYEIIKGKKFDYPIYLDIESTDRKNKEGATASSIAFCDTMEKLGYYVGIYGSDVSTFKEILDITKLTAYDKWVAKYSKTHPTYVKKYGMWQYSSKGVLDGINGYVDLDTAFIDYPTIMKNKHLNGY